MLNRKPEEIEAEIYFLEKHDIAIESKLISLLIEALVSSKYNPKLDYSGVIQNLINRMPKLFKPYSKEALPHIFRQLISFPKNSEFINLVFNFAVDTYVSYTEIKKSLQKICITLLNDPDVNPSYSFNNRPTASDLLLKNFEYIYGQEKYYSNVEWDTHERPIYYAEEKYYWNSYEGNLWKPNNVLIHFQKKPALFVAMAENYFRQYQTALQAELKQEDMAPITNNLDRLFCFAIDAARLENDFSLLTKFIEYKEQGFTPSYDHALQKIVKSFKNWMTEPYRFYSHYGCIPKKGYTERKIFQILNTHFKPLILDFIEAIRQYSLQEDEKDYPWYPGRYYHANDMLLIFRIHLSLKSHDNHYSYSYSNPELKLLLNQHALLILNTLEDYILKHKQAFIVDNNKVRLFKHGTKVTCDNEDAYLPETIAKLIKASRAVSQNIDCAHDYLLNFSHSLKKAVPEGKDADKPEKRSQYVHKFYIALRDEDLNHPIIKILSKTVTRKILEPDRQQIASALDDIAPVLERQMDPDAMRLIYEYADIAEIKLKETEPAILKPLIKFS